MADSEKLTALKKAYADIILNTAKEAAARIMVSERKTLRYQQELFASKDEALRMLLRLKQMLDAKVNEAEMTSLSQQRRIEELEAQLGEAEDIVRDLRAELSEVQEELEKVTKNQMQLLDEQILKNDIATQATTSEENRFNASGSVISSLPEAQPGLVLTSDMKNSALNGTYEGNKFYSEYGSHKDNCFAFNSDFASIVMRNKEPELYRNGCTQRIRAFERILLEGNLSLSGQVEGEKDEKSIREVEEDKDMCIKPAPKAANLCGGEENPDELKVVQSGSNCIQVLAVKSFRRKRKRATRYKKSKLSSFRNFPDQVIEMSHAPDLSCPETFTYAVENNIQSRENSRITENEDQKDPDCPLGPKLPSDATEMLTQSDAEVTKSDVEFLKACTVRNMTNNDQVLRDDSQLTRQESESADNSDVLACKGNLETVNVSIENSDVKASTDLTEGISTQPVDNRFLKYTFQRKRKKEYLSSPDRDSSLDKSTSKRKTEEKQINSLELQKCGLISESSRDSRRLAQVARQLISLSEKKWQ